MSNYQYSPLSRLLRIRDFLAARAPTEAGRECVDGVHFHTSGFADVSESVSDGEITAVGSWNSITEYADGKSNVVDATPERFGRVLERLGLATQYSDQTGNCDDCGRLIDTEPSSYVWRPYYVELQGSLVCLRCLKKNDSTLEDYARELEKYRRLDWHEDVIDFSAVDYRLVKLDATEDHLGGADAAMKKIMEFLKAQGMRHFFFLAYRENSFTQYLHTWIHVDDLSKFKLKEGTLSAVDRLLNERFEELKQSLPDQEEDDDDET